MSLSCLNRLEKINIGLVGSMPSSNLKFSSNRCVRLKQRSMSICFI
ncbi:hypothetical protein PDIG_78900 [Penicillium digitatum PHI26]|uniref:Uncharacterized protein n=2 Tax=Penicillium digitatum TaxID=36651 RepID=K9FD69_PEND2|nr:hypothetical protein PDIP_27310 [Penicillium digitatum Pd1]EKV06112.1 hypothetical protein PDIG_78900 [Penicillium digitatum PHI26]EKV18464.1 hypothetical protein PDIP_27310 [Penicillium digitatum Pd1]